MGRVHFMGHSLKTPTPHWRWIKPLKPVKAYPPAWTHFDASQMHERKRCQTNIKELFFINVYIHTVCLDMYMFAFILFHKRDKF